VKAIFGNRTQRAIRAAEYDQLLSNTALQSDRFAREIAVQPGGDL
jgi:hypothetical protein